MQQTIDFFERLDRILQRATGRIFHVKTVAHAEAVALVAGLLVLDRR